MDKYYHGYLDSHNGLPGVFPRVRVSDTVYGVGEDIEVHPVVVLLPHGRFLAGATLGVGMLTLVCLDVLPDRAGSSWLYSGGNSAWRLAWSEAWAMAGEEARIWASHLAEEAAEYDALGGCAECGCNARLCDLDDDGRCPDCVEAGVVSWWEVSVAQTLAEVCDG